MRTPPKVREARKALDLSREGLAYRAGVSINTVDNIEQGRVSPSVHTAIAVARVLKRTVEELFGEAS